MLPDSGLYLADEVIRHRRELEARLALQGLAPAFYPRRSFCCPCAHCGHVATCLAAAYEYQRGLGYCHENALLLAHWDVSTPPGDITVLSIPGGAS